MVMNTAEQEYFYHERSFKIDKISSLSRKHFIIASLGLVAFIGTVLFLSHWWFYGRYIESTNDAYLQADLVTIFSRVGGFVDQVIVQDNQMVKAGQILAKIDERNPKASFEQAQALIDQGKASIEQTNQQVAEQNLQINVAHSQLQSAQADADFADKEAQRFRVLSSAGAETREHYDQAVNNASQAHTKLVQATSNVKAQELQLPRLAAVILGAKAQIEQAVAQQHAAKVDLDATNVIAPIDGKVGDRTIRLGQLLQPGTRLMTIVPIEKLYLVANFKETQIQHMRPKQPVEIKVDALGGQIFSGTVESFSPGTGSQFALLPPNNATGNFTKVVQRIPVKILIDPSPEQRQILVPGMSVTAYVNTKPSGEESHATDQSEK